MTIRACVLFGAGCLLVLGAGGLRGDEAEDKAAEVLKKLKGRVSREAKGEKHVTAVNLGSTKVTDADLQAVAAFKQLKVLDLNFTQVSDAGMKHLAGLDAPRQGVLDRPVKRRHVYVRAERGLADRHRYLADEVVALTLE